MPRGNGSGVARKPGSGGARQGTPGVTYKNRSDLRQGPTQPVRTAPNQAYGVAGQQAQAQQQIPLANMPQPGAPAPPTGAPGAAPMGMGPGPAPGLGSLTGPTQRPDEHFMSGAPAGPGPMAPPAPPDPLVKAAAVLNSLGSTADIETAALRKQINATLGNRGAP